MEPEEEFNILVTRKDFSLPENLVRGEISVNNMFLGRTYERIDKRIRVGSYPGRLRFVSRDGHAQGPFGEIGKEGDFLLEIGNVTWESGEERTSLLFHGGERAELSMGCVMLGAVPRRNGVRYLPEDHTLRKLRRAFYGSDLASPTPNKKITITILE